MLEEIQSAETNSVLPSDEEKSIETGGEQKTDISFRATLSRKAARIFDESGYSEDEFISMLHLYEDTMKKIEQGKIVQGSVVMITNDSVIVDIGFKSEGTISLQEFGVDSDIEVGDTIEVFLDDFENQEGQLVLSKQKADFMKVWDKIRDIHEKDERIKGCLVRRIKGGIVVDLLGVDAFLPGSQIDIRQVKNFDQYIGEMCELKIIKINKIRRNIVVSRRAVLEEERNLLRETVLTDLEIGQIRKGMVKNITDFGAFIDLGGVDGLLHITDMSWGRINHPSELVSIGDNIDVKILNYEEGKTRISLGMKQMTPYPWEGVDERYPQGSVVEGKVVSTTDYGAFVELERGIEGLVHISEMSWTQHVKHPSKIVNVGDVIECKILSVDKQGEKISLGIKQLEPDPWVTIDEHHPVGSRVDGKVRNLTNFGAFVEIQEGIDGLVHISDMSWTKRIKHPSEVMKKGDTVEVVILDIDKDNRRISLGHKQIFEDPWSTLEEKFAVGMITSGIIIRILDRGVVVALENDIEGFVPTFQLAQDIKKPAEAFKTGDELPLKVIEFEKEQRKIILSVREYFKDKDKTEFDEFKEKYKPQPATIGDSFSDIFDTPVEKTEDSSLKPAAEKTAAVAESVQTAEAVAEKGTPEPEPEKAVEETAESVEETAEDGEEVKVGLEETVPPEGKEDLPEVTADSSEETAESVEETTEDGEEVKVGLEETVPPEGKEDLPEVTVDSSEEKVEELPKPESDIESPEEVEETVIEPEKITGKAETEKGEPVEVIPEEVAEAIAEPEETIPLEEKKEADSGTGESPEEKAEEPVEESEEPSPEEKTEEPVKETEEPSPEEKSGEENNKS